MLANVIPVCMFFSSFVTNTNGMNVLQQLEKLFQVGDNYDRREYLQKASSHSRHHQINKKQERYPNLLNIQTLNLYGKPSKRARDDTEFDKFLRTETDRICKQTGRCGCSRGRCGDKPDEAADEVDELVNEINNQLAKDNEGNGNTNKIVDTLNDNKQNLDSGDNDDDVKKGQKIKLNDNVDVVVLHPNEINELLRKQDFIDLTRNSIILDTDTGKYSFGPQNPDHLRELISEIMKSGQSNEKPAYQSPNKVTPNELFKYYDSLKNQVTNLITFYIKNYQKKNPIEKQLSPNQLQGLANLKLKYQRGELKENEIKSEVIGVVFGEGSETKVLPHSEDSRNIYIPKKYYEDILNGKKSYVRAAQKRVFPLTVQQKSRLSNKDKTNIIPKLVWRRNQRFDDQNYGVPFKLEVQGLSQINPNQ